MSAVARARSALRYALILCTIAFFGARAAADVPLDGLDAYVVKAIADWEVPGLAIAIVKDDQVVLAQGFGVRKLGEETPTTTQTLFAIGSSSKAFTAACLAMLVDEDELNWDDPATLHLTELVLFDPYATRELTVRDLLCHRSGLARGDFLWYATDYDRAEILRRLRFLEPTWSFRSHFGYQNIMYLAAGQIIPQITGQSWDEFVKERIFLPLGMKTACTSVNELAERDDVATPHVKLEGKIDPVAWRNIDNVAPAGSINANVAEMAQWVRLQLGEGRIDNRRLLSAEALREMHTPQTIIPPDDNFTRYYPDAHFLTYGLGWFLHDYHGRKIVEHGGAIDGMRAQVALIPEEKLGLVILCNRGGTSLPRALMFHVFDRYLGGSQHDWSAEMLAVSQELEQKADEEKAKRIATRVADTKPSRPLEDYAGKFTNRLYGDAHVELADGKLLLKRGSAVAADLEHWHYDTFQARFRDRVLQPELITFHLDAEAKIASVDLSPLGTFERRP